MQNFLHLFPKVQQKFSATHCSIWYEWCFQVWKVNIVHILNVFLLVVIFGVVMNDGTEFEPSAASIQKPSSSAHVTQTSMQVLHIIASTLSHSRIYLVYRHFSFKDTLTHAGGCYILSRFWFAIEQGPLVCTSQMEKCIIAVLRLPFRLYLIHSFFSVVDLCMSGISARCNQATVAFLRLLVSTLFFSIMEVACCRAKLLFFCYISPTPCQSGLNWWVLGRLAGNGIIAQLLGKMKQNNSQRRWEDGQI